MKKKVCAVVLAAVILLAGLALFASNPLLSCNITLPDGYREAIESQAKGIYSQRVPLVPVYVTVDHFSNGKAFYTIHYFPFGTVGMSYTAQDGYGIEKQLSGLS